MLHLHHHLCHDVLCYLGISVRVYFSFLSYLRIRWFGLFGLGPAFFHVLRGFFGKEWKKN
jgi:hypothetical protein